jgi:F-box/WD-40 domain protein 7
VFAERFRLQSNWLAGRCTVRTFEGHTQGENVLSDFLQMKTRTK